MLISWVLLIRPCVSLASEQRRTEREGWYWLIVEDIDISCSEIAMAMVYAVAIKPDRINKVDGASIRPRHFHSASVHGV